MPFPLLLFYRLNFWSSDITFLLSVIGHTGWVFQLLFWSQCFHRQWCVLWLGDEEGMGIMKYSMCGHSLFLSTIYFFTSSYIFVCKSMMYKLKCNMAHARMCAWRRRVTCQRDPWDYPGGWRHRYFINRMSNYFFTLARRRRRTEKSKVGGAAVCCIWLVKVLMVVSWRLRQPRLLIWGAFSSGGSSVQGGKNFLTLSCHDGAEESDRAFARFQTKGERR